MGAGASVYEPLSGEDARFDFNRPPQRSDIQMMVESFVSDSIVRIASQERLAPLDTVALNQGEGKTMSTQVQPSDSISAIRSPLLDAVHHYQSNDFSRSSSLLIREQSRRFASSKNLGKSQISLRMIAMRNQSRRENRSSLMNIEYPPGAGGVGGLGGPLIGEPLADYAEENEEGNEELELNDSFVALGSPAKTIDKTTESLSLSSIAAQPSSRGDSVLSGGEAKALTPPTATVSPVTAPAAAGGAGLTGLQLKRPPPLKLGIQDDADWIQVSDDEEGGDIILSPRKKPNLSLSHTLLKAADQSYMFTQSGTIFVNGFKDGIGIEGIQSNMSKRASKKAKVPMKDRLVLLTQLGHGASGVVYKALDLMEMRIVALKMINVYEQAKRRQMVRELTALFDVFRQKKKDFKKHQEGGKLVAAMSQLSLFSGLDNRFNKGLVRKVSIGKGILETSPHSDQDARAKAILSASTEAFPVSNVLSDRAKIKQQRKTLAVLEPVCEQPDVELIHSSSVNSHSPFRRLTADTRNIAQVLKIQNISMVSGDGSEAKSVLGEILASQEVKADTKEEYKAEMKLWSDNLGHAASVGSVGSPGATSGGAGAESGRSGGSRRDRRSPGDQKSQSKDDLEIVAIGAVANDSANVAGMPAIVQQLVGKTTPLVDGLDLSASPKAETPANGVGSVTFDSKVEVEGEAVTESVFKSPRKAQESSSSPQSESPRHSHNNKSGSTVSGGGGGGSHHSRGSSGQSPLSVSSPAPVPVLGTGVQRFLGRSASDYIVDFHDAFSNIDDGGVALMMEYMDGGSLQDIVDDGGCDDEITLANIAVQALIGLAFLHSCGQLHRDLKPGNFLISHRGEVKVADLGILVQLEKTAGGDESNTSMFGRDESQSRSSSHSGTNSGSGSNNNSASAMAMAMAMRKTNSANSEEIVTPTAQGHGSAGESSAGASNSNDRNGDGSSRGGGGGGGGSRRGSRDRDTGAPSYAPAVAPGKDPPVRDPSAKCMSPFHSYKAGSPMPYTKTFVGTVTFMAPERIDGREYSYPSDVWAFGLSLLSVALGHLPIDTKGGYWTILHCIRDSEPPSVPDDGRFSEEFRDFISRCLQKDPEKRMSCNELLFHPFLNKAVPEECGFDDGEQDIDPAEAEAKGVVDLQSILIAVHLHFERMKGHISALETVRTARTGRSAVEFPQTEHKKGPGDKGPNAGAGAVSGGKNPDHLHPYFAGLKDAPSTEAFLKDFIVNFAGIHGSEKPSLSSKGKTSASSTSAGGTSDAIDHNSPAASSSSVEIARKRLEALAYQLHLSADVLLVEAHKICKMIEKAAAADPDCEDPDVKRIRLASKVTKNESPRVFHNRIRRDSK